MDIAISTTLKKSGIFFYIKDQKYAINADVILEDLVNPLGNVISIRL